jgi:GNAT superfamily N-acetyltransferase
MTKMTKTLYIRDIRKDEFATLGRLMVDVYSNLAGFPSPDEQPGYYDMLRNIGRFSKKKDVRVLVAISADDELVGRIVYFGDMAEYGSGGIATTVKNASGIRLLGVSARARGTGIGKALARACIQLARDNGHSHVVLHTTHAMQVAWSLYEKLGFERSRDLDFMQEDLQVFGFRLWLGET